MPSHNYQLLAQAIKDGLQVCAQHHGRYRELSVHLLGYKGHKEQVLCVQFGGESNSAGTITVSQRVWRCMAVADLSNITLREGTWYNLETKGEHESFCLDDIPFIAPEAQR